MTEYLEHAKPLTIQIKLQRFIFFYLAWSHCKVLLALIVNMLFNRFWWSEGVIIELDREQPWRMNGCTDSVTVVWRAERSLAVTHSLTHERTLLHVVTSTPHESSLTRNFEQIFLWNSSKYFYISSFLNPVSEVVNCVWEICTNIRGMYMEYKYGILLF